MNEFISHLYIRYRDEDLNIKQKACPNSDILIYDAGQYDTVYINIGVMKGDVPYLNKSEYWNLDYYELEFDEEKVKVIKKALIEFVAHEFCCKDYRILDDTADDNWSERYRRLKHLLENTVEEQAEELTRKLEDSD